MYVREGDCSTSKDHKNWVNINIFPLVTSTSISMRPNFTGSKFLHKCGKQGNKISLRHILNDTPCNKYGGLQL